MMAVSDAPTIGSWVEPKHPTQSPTGPRRLSYRVVAVVPDEHLEWLAVVKRWDQRKRAHFAALITAAEWEMGLWRSTMRPHEIGV
jgi:hypothetical protein